MATDSTLDVQEALAAAGPNSPTDDQEGDGSRTDVHDAMAHQNRLNGLMRLVGKRTTEAQQQKDRADQAEARLAEMQSRLAAYEEGAHMTPDEVSGLEAEEQGEAQADAEEQLEQGNGLDSDTNFDFWWPSPRTPNGLPPAQYIDPNTAVSRASALRGISPSETQRLQTSFDRELADALDAWGVEQPD